jgi:hypothetical protein
MTITGLVFMIAFLGSLALALFRDPIYGLLAYLADFYVHPPSRWWGQFLPDLRWSMLAAVVTLVAIWIHLPKDDIRQRWYLTTPGKLMILFALWFWIGMLWALDPIQHYPTAIYLSKYLLVFYMIYRIIDTPAKMTAFLLVHVAGCLYLGVLGYGADPSTRLDGVGGPGIDDSNTLGMQLATGVVAASMFTMHLRGWRRLLCFVSIAFASNAIVLAGSRGAFLALLAGGATLYYLRPVIYKRVFYVYAVLGVLAFGYVASAGFWQRMDTMTVAAAGDQEDMDTSARSRIEMIKAQLQMAKSCPLGCGHRASEVLSPKYLDQQYMTAAGVRSSHNVFMTLLVEQGIPGAVLFLLIVRWTAQALRQLRRDTIVKTATAQQTERAVLAATVGGSLVVVLVGGLFADFSKCEVQVWMIALLTALTQPWSKRESWTTAVEEITGKYQVAAARSDEQ